ncbi:hypothetical protein LCGC14_2352470, partial [marine sediment metagenome]
FKVAGRTIERYETRLRRQGKIKYRKDLNAIGKQKTRFKHSEVLEEVQVYLDNARALIEKRNDVYKDIKLKVIWDKKKQTEDLALIWSDMHTGMINKHPLTGQVTYNEKIQEEELQSLLKGVFRFHQLYKPSYNLETFYIFDVGDNITNDRIYEGQQAEITCGVGEQILKCFEYQSDFIKRVLEIFPKVVLIKMAGNHGRTTSRPISEETTSSFEYLCGKLLQERFKDNKRVEIIVPDMYRYTVEIRGHKYLLSHGNNIRGCTLNSIERAVKDLSTLAYKEFYDLMIIGHFHTALKLRITPETTLLVNGCFIHMDDYAYNKLRKFSSPTQYLFNISKKSAMHNLQEINLLWK